ncbi:peptidylprolyl isomerase [Rubellimicrobium rubrum]|uniref:Parvulin-like PPIase n=1 Tax=Rubellimicrobium rubrum TaxID=2585369 RepID=A0A5C4MQS4_9RHOB|nr:peptidylprolyl isomerase [Rubellimicrobium rubrum]TNC46419.1 peptidylprolyl isomerase [Rubellimicrobium rubrum]
MLKPLLLLQTVSVLALTLALPVAAQDATQEAPAVETPEAATTEPAADAAPAGEAATEAPAGEATAQPATDVTRDTVVASVNGTDITVGELLIAVRQLPPQYQQLPPDVLFGAVVDQLVQQELLAQTATEPSAAVDIALANQRRSLLANEVIGDIAGTAVSEEALQAAYDAQYGSMEPANEWNASHILVASEEEATAAVDRINAGEAFEDVAKEVSTDTGSGSQGGELGWFGPGMMVPEFEQGVSGLQPGQLSAPVQSQFGWHIIRLNETRPQEAPALEDVRAELEAQIQQEAIQARLSELEAAGQVTKPQPGQFDPAVLNDTSLLED